MGPLDGIRIIEIAGIGPGPFCAMMLADMGADVIRVDRAGLVKSPMPDGPSKDALNRGRRSLAVDLKNPDGVEAVLKLVEGADALIEGFRPGVCERLGIGPDVCQERNPKLVFGRMTGWGQQGPMAHAAGHDINYIALSGVLGAIGRKDSRPVPPLNLVGDFGGGGMLLAYGVVCGILSAQRTGKGQVIDAAMVDGAALLATMMFAMQGMGIWNDERGTNMLDTGAPFYDVYECSDGLYISIGSIEPQFYAELMEKSGMADPDLPEQLDRKNWPVAKEMWEELFRTKSRAEWTDIMEGTDICFAPVLSLAEATTHPHNVERGTFIDVAGVHQPGPAPRFDGEQLPVQRPAPHPGQHTAEVLADFGFDAATIESLQASGAVA